MKTWNIIVKNNNKDPNDINSAKGENKLIIPTWQMSGKEAVLSANIFKERGHNLDPNEAIRDLMIVTLAVYSTDQMISRESFDFQGWRHHFKLYIPVSALDVCKSGCAELSIFLSFLSGDNWEVFVQKDSHKEARQEKLIIGRNPLKINKVSLFSGGMDSFIGAPDFLSNNEKNMDKILKNLKSALLVLHSPQGTTVGIENTAQIYHNVEKGIYLTEK